MLCRGLFLCCWHSGWSALFSLVLRLFFWVFFNIQQQIQRLPAVQFIAGQTRNIMTVVIANETWWMAAPEVVKTTQEQFCVCFLTDVFGVLQTRHASLCNVQEMKSCLEPMNNSSCTPLVVPYELFNRFNAQLPTASGWISQAEWISRGYHGFCSAALSDDLLGIISARRGGGKGAL